MSLVPDDQYWNKTWPDTISIPQSTQGNSYFVAIGQAVGAGFSQLMNELFTTLFDPIAKGGDKNVIAIGSSADSINSANTAIFNDEQRARTQPSASFCAGKRQGATILSAESTTATQVKTISQGRVKTTVSRNAALKGTSGHSATTSSISIAEKNKNKFGDFTKSKNLADLLNPDTVLDAAKLEATNEAINILVGHNASNGAGSLIDYVKDGKIETSTKASKALRAISTSTSAASMLSVLQARMMVNTGDNNTFHRVLESEIARTYGDTGADWRATIKGFSNPLPLMKELNTLYSFNNYMLYLNYMEIEREYAMTILRTIELLRVGAIKEGERNDKTQNM